MGMTWVKNLAFTSGDLLTAAQLNQIADNLEETAPGKTTGNNTYIVATGPNSVAEREPVRDIQNNAATTTSQRYGDLDVGEPAPTITAITGTAVLICFAARISNTTNGTRNRVSYNITGATSKPAANNRSIVHESVDGYQTRPALVVFDPRLTPGTNTFTLQYMCSGGTMTAANRRLVVVPF